MKSLSDITASGFAGDASAFASGAAWLPQHDTTPATALAQELAGNGYVGAVNTFLGEGAGSLVSVGTGSTVNGGRNVAIGYRAGEANTSGWQNTGIGFISLLKTTSGQYNTALGAYTLVENTTGSANTGLGADALWKNTTGQANTAIGSYSAQQNITGSDIVAIGVHALRYGTAASGSVAIGMEALRDTTATDNTAVGVQAGRLNQSGSNNSIFGARAFWKSVTGNENVAFGPYALFNANGAHRNIAIGFGALQNTTTGSYNVSIGYNSGSAITDGEHNVFIGLTAGNTTTTGDRNILIGHGIVASAPGASDEINIGGVFKGNRSTLLTEIAGNLKFGDGTMQTTASVLVVPADSTGGGHNYLSRWHGTVDKELLTSRVRVDDIGNLSVGHLAAEHEGEVRCIFGGTLFGTSGVFEAKDQFGVTLASIDAGAGMGTGRVLVSNATSGATFYAAAQAEEIQFLSIDEADPEFVGKDIMFAFAGVNSLRLKRSGKVLLGTEDATGASLLKVGGAIESLSGGFVFPDDTVQTTAYTGGGTRGVTTVNFGAFPGASDASATITGQAAIGAGSRVRAWIEAKATADHSADEHWLETIDVMAGSVVDGTGFTIYAKNTGTLSEPVMERWADTRLAGPGTGINQIRPDNGGGKATRLCGEFTVGWEWY